MWEIANFCTERKYHAVLAYFGSQNRNDSMIGMGTIKEIELFNYEEKSLIDHFKINRTKVFS